MRGHRRSRRWSRGGGLAAVVGPRRGASRGEPSGRVIGTVTVTESDGKPAATPR